MCGIAGFWGFNSESISEKDFDLYVDSIAHRGPDGRGVYNDSNNTIFLGHRRLSILDLSSLGAQPMTYLNRYTITFNGEIYNFIELKKELIDYGFKFYTESDTEVILASYIKWGEDCQFKFNGMWAFAIWDNFDRKLFLSRDRFGVKPLFYIITVNYLFFTSELKGFMSLPNQYRPTFNKGVIAALKNIENSQETFLNGVKNLNAGHCLMISQDKKISLKKWWKTKDHLIKVSSNYNDQVEQYRDLFFDACKIRMRSDVPIGTALSGGLDSSSVICSMAYLNSNNDQRKATNWKKAFVLDFKNSKHSERKYAEEIIEYVHADPIIKEIDLNNITPEDLSKATFSFEAIQEPALGPWLIYKEMRNRNIVVSIDGHGGDEQLAGYHHYCKSSLIDAALSFNKKRFNDIQSIYLGMFEKETPEDFIQEDMDSMNTILIQYYLNKVKNTKLKKYFDHANYLIQNINKKTTISNSIHDINKWSIINKIYPKVLSSEKTTNFDLLNEALYYDFHSGSLPTILRNFDRVSMASGVEIRAPFLDWRLTTFAFSLSSSVKLGQGYTKKILRDSMNGIIPDSIRLRKGKIGFSSPMGNWLKGEVMKTFISDTVNSQNFLHSDIWDGNLIADYVYNNDDLKKVWPYIQANILLDSFEKSANDFDKKRKI